MQIVPLGKITVAASGTPVPLSATSRRCCAIHFQAITGETGKMLVGDSTVRVATMVGGCHMFWPTGSGGGQPDAWDMSASSGFGNSIDAARVYVDAQVNGESLLATLYIR